MSPVCGNFYGDLQLRRVAVVDHCSLLGVLGVFSLGPHIGVLFTLLILGFPYPGGDIRLLADGFLESRHIMIAGGLVVIGCLLNGLLLAVAKLAVVLDGG